MRESRSKTLSADRIVALAALAIAVYILWRIRHVLLLGMTAVILATALNRAVQLLCRVQIKSFPKIPRGVAIFIVIIGFLIALGVFLLIIVPPFVDQFQQLIDLIPIGLERLNGILLRLEEIAPDSVIRNARDALDQVLESPRSLASQILNNFFAIFSSTLNVALSALAVFVITIMLLATPVQYRNAFVLLFPASFRDRAQEVLDLCEEALGGWIIGILFEMIVIALLSGIGLWVLGIPLPLANAMLAGLLTVIPNLGPTLSVIPPMAIGLLDAPWNAIAVLILYIIIQQIESNILTPLVMKKQVALLPAVTLISQIAFAYFFGFLGLLLALPLVIVMQVVIRELLVRDLLDHF